jgi:hypothetical protein
LALGDSDRFSHTIANHRYRHQQRSTKKLVGDNDVRKVSTNEEKQVQMELSFLQTYIDGKLKRLNLLFLVNGGAFAIVQLSANANSELIPTKALATGAIVFTTVIVYDTWLWSLMMKGRFIGELSLVVRVN